MGAGAGVGAKVDGHRDGQGWLGPSPPYSAVHCAPATSPQSHALVQSTRPGKFSRPISTLRRRAPSQFLGFPFCFAHTGLHRPKRPFCSLSFPLLSPPRCFFLALSRSSSPSTVTGDLLCPASITFLFCFLLLPLPSPSHHSPPPCPVLDTASTPVIRAPALELQPARSTAPRASKATPTTTCLLRRPCLTLPIFSCFADLDLTEQRLCLLPGAPGTSKFLLLPLS